MQSELKKTNDKFEASTSKVSKFGNVLIDSEGKASKMNKPVANVTKVVTGLGIAAAGISFKNFTEFETSLAKVSTLADTSKKSIDELKTEIIELSNSSGISAKELNEALYQALSASVDTAGAVDFLITAIKASKGGFAEVTVAVDGMTSVMNTYGIAVEGAEKLANQFLITQNKGKTTFGELASSIGKLAPVANAVGLSTDEMFSSLAAVTAQGLATSEAVSALKAAIASIIKTSKQAQEVSASLGLEFSVSALRSKGWIGFLKDVKDKLLQASPELDKLVKQQKKVKDSLVSLEKQGKKTSKEYKSLKAQSKALKTEMEYLTQAADSNVGGFSSLFGSVEGLNSILMLTSETGMASYNSTMEEMKNNTTALDDAFNTMNETQGEAWAKIKTQVENLGISFGEKLVPVAEKVLEFFQWVLDNSDDVKDLLLGIGAALLTFNVVTLIQKLINGFIAWKKATEGLTLAQQLLNIALKSNVWVWIISLVAGLVVWIIRLWNTCEGFRNFWADMWNGICGWVDKAIKAVKLFFSLFRDKDDWLEAKAEFDSAMNKDRKISTEYAHTYTSDLNRVLSSFSSRANRNLNRAVVGQTANRSYVKNNYTVSINNKFGDRYSERDTKKILNQINKELGRRLK